MSVVPSARLSPATPSTSPGVTFIVDSWNSDPDNSPPLLPFLLHRRQQRHRRLAATANGALSIGNGEILGYARTGGGTLGRNHAGLVHALGTTVHNPGRVSTDFSATFPGVTVPTLAATSTNSITSSITTTNTFPRTGDVAASDGIYYYNFSGTAVINLAGGGMTLTIANKCVFLLTNHATIPAISTSGNASFVWSLRPGEVLMFYGRLYGLRGSALRRRVEELIEGCELTGHKKTEYNELSTGLKQRLAFAKALLNDPEVLFLDEPTLGLDPAVSIRIRAQIARLRRERGTTVILTTHYMREAEELCDEIAFIKGGRILAQGGPDALKRKIRLGDVIMLRLDPLEPAGLASLPGVLEYRIRDAHLECTVDVADKRLPELLRWLHEQGVVVRQCEVREPDLEEVFVELNR